MMKILTIPSTGEHRAAAVGILAMLCCVALMLAFSLNAGAQNTAKPDNTTPVMKKDVYKVERLDESAIPAQKHQEWNTLKRKLAAEYTDCNEDCGQGEDCQDRCWDVYNYRLDQEYQRMIYESTP